MIPLVTAFIAAIVAGVAFLQWQTARQKVLLDLFDKRFALYAELCAIVPLRGDGDKGFRFITVAKRADFLFGSEVQKFLRERASDLVNVEVEQMRLRDVSEEKQRAAVEAKLASLADRMNHFVRDFDELVAPYMRHHQKALRSRSDWIDMLRQMFA